MKRYILFVIFLTIITPFANAQHNAHSQFNNQNCYSFHAVQSKSSLTNRRGSPHLVSDSAWFAAALG